MRRMNLLCCALLITLSAMSQRNPGNLIPDTPSKAPDYYCTWNLQGYVTSYANGSGSNDLRIEINEDNLFGDDYGYAVWGKNRVKKVNNSGSDKKLTSWTVDTRYQGWLDHYPMLRGDLTFVMDDSWDIPKGEMDTNGICDYYVASKRPYGSNYDNIYLARMAVDETRFPSFIGSDVERMTQLVEAVKQRGWRSLGGWVCAQDSIMYTKEYTGKENNKQNSTQWTEEQEELFWKKRMRESEQAGFTYWKVDWGNKDRDADFRRNLTAWAAEVAPNLIIEHAIMTNGYDKTNKFVEYSPVLRTYDVDNNIAQTQTIERVCNLLAFSVDKGLGILNCEDEPYIAAGLGCAIGVMRHPYVGNMPNGQRDTYFADYSDDSRRLKNRLNEIVRGVRWHRIAVPFGVDGGYKKDDVTLEESGNGKRASAPARISRHLPLPKYVSGESSSLRPYLLASLYKNGTSALAIINRNIDGVYQQQRVDVSFEPYRWDRKVGIFGLCKSVTLNYQNGLPKRDFKVFAQDLAVDGEPQEIEYTLTDNGKGIIIDGATIERLCMGHDYPYTEVEREADKDYTDLSEPAIVLMVVQSEETDEVNALSADQQCSDDVAYTLGGVCVFEPLTAGVYLKGEQKILLR